MRPWQRVEICSSASAPSLEPFEVTNHTTPRRMGNVLRNANAKHVVLTHLYPQAQGYEEETAREVGEL